MTKKKLELAEMNVGNAIQGAITLALEKLRLPEVSFAVEHPGDEGHGDYSSNVALQSYRLQAKPSDSHVPGGSKPGLNVGTRSDQKGYWANPREMAIAIKDEILKQVQDDRENWLEKIDIAGPGFINFFLKDSFLAEQASRVLSDGKRFGESKAFSGKRVIVEYSSPNIAKPFTIGHLRSTIIGDAVANVLAANGWEVLRDNHLGDWGTQFGKQIYAIKAWGDEKKIANSTNPVKDLVALYVKFHEEAEKETALEDEARKWFRKLEAGDEEARRLWKLCTDWSWKEFSRIYDLLNVHHSPEFEGGRGLGEAFFEDKMGVVIKALEKKDLLKAGKEGAKLVFFAGDKLPPAMILKKDGATLYHTRDLATDFYRLKKYKPDLIINEVGAEQTLYFRQLFEMERLLGWYTLEQRVHIGHGLIRFKEGKMSTRKGNVVWLEEVLEEAAKRAFDLQKIDSEFVDNQTVESKSEKISRTAKERIPGAGARLDMAREVGIGALKWNDLKGSPQREVVFDWDEILNMKGNSGPYIQYTYARAQSVVKNSAYKMPTGVVLNDEERAVLGYVYRFPEVVLEAGKQYAPHLVCTYLYELSSRFNRFYNKHSVLKAETEEKKQLRLVLTASVAQVLKNGLGLLGIGAPARM